MKSAAAAIAALGLCLTIGSPLVASAHSSMMMTKPPHMCRDAKGRFIKGKYMKCPAGTHHA
ncbi:MAG: hypothetical protein IAI49_14155 [Candidatus Eremiobacteraeota bacterium]|nr:hypothetical protein [Candidatus Eremiobacteraeota bacterium]